MLLIGPSVVLAQGATFDPQADKIRKQELDQKQREAEARRRAESFSIPPTEDFSDPAYWGRAAPDASMTPAEQTQWDAFTRWDPDSGYRRSVSMNPSAGAGDIGDWHYEVRHDVNGGFGSALIVTRSRDVATGGPIPIAVVCDPGSADGTGSGPVLYLQVDYSQIMSQPPSRISLIASTTQQSLGAGYLESAWKHDSGGVSRIRETGSGDLTSALQSAISFASFHVEIRMDQGLIADAEVSPNGFFQAFEKLAPCWNR